ncbi:hypothetical protein [Streptomyces sp. NPDC058812]|uniref:hypothetical protein n=1 Tax=unclassified Streptomyces TaxID=2593676 RepID=UPI00369499CC
MDPELLERITARRAELDELEEKLARQLVEVRAERDELAVAERVFGGWANRSRMSASRPRWCPRRWVGGRSC